MSALVDQSPAHRFVLAFPITVPIEPRNIEGTIDVPTRSFGAAHESPRLMPAPTPIGFASPWRSGSVAMRTIDDYDGLFLQMFLRYVVQSASGTVKYVPSLHAIAGLTSLNTPRLLS